MNLLPAVSYIPGVVDTVNNGMSDYNRMKAFITGDKISQDRVYCSDKYSRHVFKIYIISLILPIIIIFICGFLYDKIDKYYHPIIKFIHYPSYIWAFIGFCYVMFKKTTKWDINKIKLNTSNTLDRNDCFKDLS